MRNSSRPSIRPSKEVAAKETMPIGDLTKRVRKITDPHGYLAAKRAREA